jgi:arylsulfatase A-like enzyme
MVEQMDTAIGRVLAALDRTGLAERTMVILMSDNGGECVAGGAPTANAPLRAGKGWLYEGGIREPWIIWAPGLTKPGSLCDTPVISTDFYATILDFAGLSLNPSQHIDGVSLVPLLKAQAFQRGPLFWHYPHYGNQGGAPSGAVRDGDWKLIEWYEDGQLELFNLRSDLGEHKNLAAENPTKAKELQSRLAAWRTEVKAVMPTPNPDWTGKQEPQKRRTKPRAKPRAAASARWADFFSSSTGGKPSRSNSVAALVRRDNQKERKPNA